ncbi:MAG: CBS domain-containing protein [Pseudomonadota bacterium]
MKVSVMLQKKGSADVATIAPSATLGDAVGTLSERGIGALVVTSGDGEVEGILSERDVVRQIGAKGSNAMSEPVSSVMTSSVETCVADDTAFDLLGRMTQGRFRHMPVVGADNRMIGILSIGDVVKSRLEEIEAENAAMADMLSH